MGGIERLIERYRDVDNEISRIGRDRLENASDLRKELEESLREYRGEATGHGNFPKYIEFKEKIIEYEERIDDEDIYLEEKFREIIETLDKRTIKDRDFEHAHDVLEEIARETDLLSEYQELENDLESRFNKVEKKIKNKEHEIQRIRDKIDRRSDLPDKDPEKLEDLIQNYNNSVESDFYKFRDKSSIKEIYNYLEKVDSLPLLELEIPDELEIETVLENEMGEKDIETILEMAGYSDKKLGHYVDNPSEFKSSIPVSWLEALDPVHLEIDIEQSEETLRYVIPEIKRALDMFASNESYRYLREIENIVVNGEYGDMRSVYLAGGEGTGMPGSGDELREDVEKLSKEIDELEEKHDKLSSVL